MKCRGSEAKATDNPKRRKGKKREAGQGQQKAGLQEHCVHTVIMTGNCQVLSQEIMRPFSCFKNSIQYVENTWQEANNGR